MQKEEWLECDSVVDGMQQLQGAAAGAESNLSVPHSDFPVK